MNRDFSNWDLYLDILADDIYDQPPDAGHLQMLRNIFHKWIPKMQAKNVLDLGCGQAIAAPFFRKLGIEYTGVAIGKDVFIAKRAGWNVMNMDFSFLDFEDKSFDLLWARHALEHSPAPILTLMEWRRVCRGFLCLVLPTPKYWGNTGINHYSVLDDGQWKFLLERAGFKVIWEDNEDEREYRYMAELKRKKKSE